MGATPALHLGYGDKVTVGLAEDGLTDLVPARQRLDISSLG